MNRSTWILLGSIALAGILLGLLNSSPSPNPTRQINEKETTRLLVYCAASNRSVMESIRAEYQREFGGTIELQYGPSQTLMANIEVSRTGDLFLPADESFIQMAQEKGMIAEVFPLARMKVVAAVPKGNPLAISRLEDLHRKDVRLAQASWETSAVGKITKQLLSATNQWEPLEQATSVCRTTVTDVANDLCMGAADVGIVFDAVLSAYPQLEPITIPELAAASSLVSLSVLKDSQSPQKALHFARYVAARDRGLTHYSRFGFTVEQGDVWRDRPELSLFAGSMLRPAIEDAIEQFERREGAVVHRVYNGCGILVGQIKSGQMPDAFFACDKEFMNQVSEHFPRPVDVSMNELVILVRKGNPHGISSLRDLGRKGLRVGVGHEKQCAMGWLTQNTLRAGGVVNEVMENVTVQTPTGDMLVNQLRAGSLDAAVAYLSNAAGAGDWLDAIRIQGIACSVATQPFAISDDSTAPQLAGRLFATILSAESRETFLAEGFRWVDATSPTPTTDLAVDE